MFQLQDSEATRGIWPFAKLSYEVVLCVEIKLWAPHAIDAMSSPWLRLLDGVEVHARRSSTRLTG